VPASRVIVLPALAALEPIVTAWAPVALLVLAILIVEPVVLEPTDPIFIPPVVPPWIVVVDEALVLPRLSVLVCTVVPIDIVPEAPDCIETADAPVPPWMVVVDVLIVEPTFTLEIDEAVLLLPMFKVWEIALELAPI